MQCRLLGAMNCVSRKSRKSKKSKNRTDRPSELGPKHFLGNSRNNPLYSREKRASLRTTPLSGFRHHGAPEMGGVGRDRAAYLWCSLFWHLPLPVNSSVTGTIARRREPWTRFQAEQGQANAPRSSTAPMRHRLLFCWELGIADLLAFSGKHREAIEVRKYSKKALQNRRTACPAAFTNLHSLVPLLLTGRRERTSPA